MMADNRPCRRDLLQWINEISFAANDAQLFLDTHPDSREALAYYEECRSKRNHALREYGKYYGPLTADTADLSETDRWNWINEPWPWQEGGC